MGKKIIFMGTPDFASSVLQSLIYGDHDVVLVVSQPDKKVGRNQEVVPTPVKVTALNKWIEVYQPENINDHPEYIEKFRPDFIVTCAYGQFISDEILNIPMYGSINVHASLLPKLRGGAPIHKAIMNGNKKTGISIMRMVKEMDAGPVMMKETVTIDELDTQASLHDKLKVVAADMINVAIDKIVAGESKFRLQNNDNATYAYNITKDEERIDFKKSIRTIYNHIRGLCPTPGAYGVIDGKKIKFFDVRLTVEKNAIKKAILTVEDKKLLIKTKNGTIEVLKLQLEGKNINSAKEFINGSGRKFIDREFE